MKVFAYVLLAVSCVSVCAQQTAITPAEALNKIAFMQGDWAGKQDFNTNGGPATVGEATDQIQLGIANRYLCEMLSTTMPGGHPTDTRHFLSFDAKLQKYTAWWFNDTSTHPSVLTGDLTGNKLVLMTDASAPGPLLRATYENPDANTLTFLVEMKMGDSWNRLFTTTYSKKVSADKRPVSGQSKMGN